MSAVGENRGRYGERFADAAAFGKSRKLRRLPCRRGDAWRGTKRRERRAARKSDRRRRRRSSARSRGSRDHVQGLNPGRTVRVRRPPLSTSEVAAMENFSEAMLPSEEMVSCGERDGGCEGQRIERRHRVTAVLARERVARRSPAPRGSDDGTTRGREFARRKKCRGFFSTRHGPDYDTAPRRAIAFTRGDVRCRWRGPSCPAF